jgi:phage FluMu protein Com
MCAWCGRILLDVDHARQHGPECEKSPIVPAIRAKTLAEIREAIDKADAACGYCGRLLLAASMLLQEQCAYCGPVRVLLAPAPVATIGPAPLDD